MDYFFWFWILLAFIAGRISTRSLFYYGNDQEKYDKAWIAIMPKR